MKHDEAKETCQCGTCRNTRMKKLNFYTNRERYNKIKEYCAANGTTATAFINSAINKQLAGFISET
jgi:hypothetical protein